MKPVVQTIHGSDGNCYEACVASIVECELDEVPDLRGENWSSTLRSWLAEKGWWVEFMPTAPATLELWSIKSELSPLGHVHAVVYKDGQMVHDPSARSFNCKDFPAVMWTALGRKLG